MIKIIKEKPLKSTTSVEGILVQVTGGQWYVITRFQPPRNPWYGRAAKAKGTRIEIGPDTSVYQKRYKSAPEWEELKIMLVDVLNGAEPVIDKMIY